MQLLIKSHWKIEIPLIMIKTGSFLSKSGYYERRPKSESSRLDCKDWKV